MPLYDYVCPICAWYKEELFPVAACPDAIPCAQCGFEAQKTIAYHPTGLLRDDAPWIRTVLEVVDKAGGEHCQRFLKEPTRANYRSWMKGEGLRPLERGEIGVDTRKRFDADRHCEKVAEYLAKRNRIEL